MLTDPLFLLLLLSLLVVVGILVTGVGKQRDGKEANRYMRWRIAAQAVAVAVILVYFFARRT